MKIDPNAKVISKTTGLAYADAAAFLLQQPDMDDRITKHVINRDHDAEYARTLRYAYERNLREGRLAFEQSCWELAVHLADQGQRARRIAAGEEP